MVIFTVTFMDGTIKEYLITLTKSENYRDAWIKVARIASEDGEIKDIMGVGV